MKRAWLAAASLCIGMFGSTIGLSLPFVAVEQDPDGDHPAEEAFAKAEVLYAKGKYKEARRAYQKIASTFPGSDVAPRARLRSEPSGFLGCSDLSRSGPSENRIDVIVMGEGYTLEKQKSFDKLAADVPKFMLRQKTLREYGAYFNFRRANVVSAEDGVDGFGREYDTALGGKTLSTYAGHVGIEAGLVRDVLAQIPEHDGQAIVFVRLGVLGTGGGGIATIGGQSVKTVVHEFGHSFMGLGDEYTTETHKRGKVRNAPNVSNTEDPESVPWAHWLEHRVSGVGVYEGAAGQVRDAWRPTPGGCVMDSGEFFCRPCREETVLDIYRRVDPIDSATPDHHDYAFGGAIDVSASPAEFSVTVLEPASHHLEVEWYVLSESRAPRGGPTDSSERYRRQRNRLLGNDRAARGRLPVLSEKPVKSGAKPKRGGVHQFQLKTRDLAPGRYRVICRVRDTTMLRGERWPWVLRDEAGILESERAWWVQVPAEAP